MQRYERAMLNVIVEVLVGFMSYEVEEIRGVNSASQSGSPDSASPPQHSPLGLDLHRMPQLKPANVQTNVMQHQKKFIRHTVLDSNYEWQTGMSSPMLTLVSPFI